MDSPTNELTFFEKRRLIYRYLKLSPFSKTSFAFILWPIKSELSNAKKAFFTGRKTRASRKVDVFAVFNSTNQERAVSTFSNANNFAEGAGMSWEKLAFWGLPAVRWKLRYFAIAPLACFIAVRRSLTRTTLAVFPLFYVCAAYHLRRRLYKELIDCEVSEASHLLVSSDHQGPVFELALTATLAKSHELLYAQHGVKLTPWSLGDPLTFENKLNQGPADADSRIPAGHSRDVCLFFNSIQSFWTRVKIMLFLRYRFAAVAVKYHPRRSANLIERTLYRALNIEDVSDLNVIQSCHLARHNICFYSGVVVELLSFNARDVRVVYSAPPFSDPYNLRPSVPEYQIGQDL